MPRVKLTKNALDDLPTPAKEVVYWDAALAKFKFSGLDLRELPVGNDLRSLPDVGLLARNDTISKNPKMLTGIARAVAKGYDYSMANPEAAALEAEQIDATDNEIAP